MFDPWVREIPQHRMWQPVPFIFLPGKSRSPWGHGEGTRLSDGLAHFSLPSSRRCLFTVFSSDRQL